MQLPRQDPVLQSEHVDAEDQSLNTSAAVPCTPWGSQRGVLSGPSSKYVFPRHELLPEPWRRLEAASGMLSRGGGVCAGECSTRTSTWM